MPLWAFGLTGWLYFAYWMLVGIPLALLWYGTLLALWTCLQMLLIVVSLLATIWALYEVSSGQAVWPLVRGLPFGLRVLDWELQGRR